MLVKKTLYNSNDRDELIHQISLSGRNIAGTVPEKFPCVAVYDDSMTRVVCHVLYIDEDDF